MKKNGKIEKLGFYRMGELAFFLLVGFYFTSGFPFLPDSWAMCLDSHTKLHKKVLTFAMYGAVVLGLLLVEWARRDETIASESLLTRLIRTWKTYSTAWVTGLFIVFGSWWTVSSYLRFESLNSGFDMAIFTQAVWNTAQGDWFYSSIKGGISLLGDHFAPLLAVFALPYKIRPVSFTLLTIQAFAAASCLFPLARIVRRSGQSPVWAVLFCLAFVLYLPVRNAVRFEFHPEVSVMPLLFWAFDFLERKKTIPASLCLILSLAAKENIATVTFAFGLYAAFFMESPELKTGAKCGSGLGSRKVFFGSMRVWGGAWMVFSAAYFLIVTVQIIPKLSGTSYAYLAGNFTEWFKLGWAPFARHLFCASTISYIFKIYGPLAFTSVLAPAPFLLTLPTLAQNLLSRNEMTRSIFFQYTATLTPFVFIASVMAVAKFRSFRRYWAYLILLTSVLMSGVSEAYPMRRAWIQLTPHARRVAEILRSIPASYSLRTHERFATHAANRRELHIYENDHPKEGGSWKARHADLVAVDRQLLRERFEGEVNALRQNGYEIELEENGFVLLRNGKLRPGEIFSSAERKN